MLDPRKMDFRFAYRPARILRHAVGPARCLLDLAYLKLSSGTRQAAFGGDRVVKVALVSDRDAPTSEQQLYPFSFYRPDLRDGLRLVSAPLVLGHVLRAPKLILSPFDIVVLKMSFRTSAAEASNVVRTIAEGLNGQRLIYFDGDDDICVQWPEILPYVDLYIKKHLFRDRNQYLRRFIGKSNLTDFVYREYDHSFSDNPVSTETKPIPADQLSKLSIVSNLASDRNILALYKAIHRHSLVGPRENDIVFRGSIPSNWMSYLRRDIEPALRRLGQHYRIMITDRPVPPDEYYQEMRSSKICISPFGYGEICWRDFEAILCGCLLIKPDMGHIETNPDVFKPYRTYVPVRWDYSDLEEKCRQYLECEHDRQRIVWEAFRALGEFYNNGGFISAVSGMLERVRERGLVQRAVPAHAAGN
jgi:hypothetical protein